MDQFSSFFSFLDSGFFFGPAIHIDPAKQYARKISQFNKTINNSAFKRSGKNRREFVV